MWSRLFLASMLIASVSAVAFPANLRGVHNVTTPESSLVGLSSCKIQIHTCDTDDDCRTGPACSDWKCYHNDAHQDNECAPPFPQHVEEAQRVEAQCQGNNEPCGPNGKQCCPGLNCYQLTVADILCQPAMASSDVSAPAPPVASKNIVDLAAATPELSTLVAALKAGALVDTLSGKGPFTVFAPNNAAFAEFPKDKLALLLEPKNKAFLDKILTYHVIAGTVIHTHDLKDGHKLFKSIEGDNLDVYHDDKPGGPHATFLACPYCYATGHDIKVMTPDVAASNGVVQIINQVLIPADFVWPSASSPSDTVAVASTSKCNESCNTHQDCAGPASRCGTCETNPTTGGFKLCVPSPSQI